MGRPRTELLSPEIIGQAAIELVESGQTLHVLTLAERLGVHVSSLYHHVAGREGILLAMRDVIASNNEYIPPSCALPWQDRIRDEIGQVWRMYARYPRSVQLLIAVIVDQPEQLTFYASIVDTLSDAGLPDEEILSTLGAIDAFALGVALDTLSAETVFDASTATPRLQKLLRNYPNGAKRNQVVLDQGLDLLILGIERRVRNAAR